MKTHKLSSPFTARSAGFTLLEILIALFIFTLLALLMTSGLHTVINTQAGTEGNAERLRKLQIALLVLSRDVEQTVNRPVLSANGREEGPFVGTPRGFIFTHAGLANPTGTLARSTLQRAGYEWHDGALWRLTWAVLDQAPQSRPHTRRLLADVPSAQFQYFDKDGHAHSEWPVKGLANQPLPRAVRVFLMISNWGKLSQLYVIPPQPSTTAAPGATPQS